MGHPQAQTKSIRYKVVTILFRRSGMFLDSPRIDTFSRNDSYSFLFLMVLPCETKKEERLHKKQSKETRWVRVCVGITDHQDPSICVSVNSPQLAVSLSLRKKDRREVTSREKRWYSIFNPQQRPDGQIHNWTERHNTLDWDKHKWSDRYMNRWSDGLFTWSVLRSDDRYMIRLRQNRSPHTLMVAALGVP